MPGVVALADKWGLAHGVELPQILFLSLEIKAFPDAITDAVTTLTIHWSLSPFPVSADLELTVANSFCQIHPWRVGGLPWDLMLLLSLVLAMGTCSHHLHHTSTLTFMGHCLFFTTLYLCLFFFFCSCPVVTWCHSHPTDGGTAAVGSLWAPNQQLPPGLLLRDSSCCQRKLLV